MASRRVGAQFQDRRPASSRKGLQTSTTVQTGLSVLVPLPSFSSSLLFPERRSNVNYLSDRFVPPPPSSSSSPSSSPSSLSSRLFPERSSTTTTFPTDLSLLFPPPCPASSWKGYLSDPRCRPRNTANQPTTFGHCNKKSDRIA